MSLQKTDGGSQSRELQMHMRHHQIPHVLEHTTTCSEHKIANGKKTWKVALCRTRAFRNLNTSCSHARSKHRLELSSSKKEDPVEVPSVPSSVSIRYTAHTNWITAVKPTAMGPRSAASITCRAVITTI